MLKESKNSVKPSLFAKIGKKIPKVSSFLYLHPPRPPLFNDFWYIACKRKTEKPHMGLLSSGGKIRGARRELDRSSLPQTTISFGKSNHTPTTTFHRAVFGDFQVLKG